MMDAPVFHVSELPLSTYIINALLNAEVRTIEQLASASDEDLLRLRGIGPVAIAQIRAAVPQEGSRKMTPEETLRMLEHQCKSAERSRDAHMRHVALLEREAARLQEKSTRIRRQMQPFIALIQLAHEYQHLPSRELQDAIFDAVAAGLGHISVGDNPLIPAPEDRS